VLVGSGDLPACALPHRRFQHVADAGGREPGPCERLPDTDGGPAWAVGTRPSKANVQDICHRISKKTDHRSVWMDTEAKVAELNRMISGWANYFTLGQVSPAYKSIDRHTIRRLRRWLCHKHKVKSGQYVRFPDARLRDDFGLRQLGRTTKIFPWAKA